MKLFVAVTIDDGILHGLDALVSEQRRVAPRARWQSRAQLHLTLSFLGEVTNDQLDGVRARVTEVARQHGPFAIELSSAGGFPDVARPRVLWLGVAGDTDALAALQSQLQQALQDFAPAWDDRDFHPHLTLARSARRSGDTELGQCAAALHRVRLGPWTVRELVLYQSQISAQGMRYVALLRAPLAALGRRDE